MLKEDKYQEFRNQDFNELTKTSIFWKNDQMNVFDATITAKNIRLKLENSTTMGGWGCFSATFVGTHDLDYFLKLRKSEWVEFDTVDHATKFINEYKINKLKSIANTI